MSITLTELYNFITNTFDRLSVIKKIFNTANFNTVLYYYYGHQV